MHISEQHNKKISTKIYTFHTYQEENLYRKIVIYLSQMNPTIKKKSKIKQDQKRTKFDMAINRSENATT